MSSEIKELFSYITQYKPPIITIETKLKPFIQEYIPSIGVVDSFIKIPRPDNTADNIGTMILDEPAAVQTDPVVFELQLRAISKKRNDDPIVVNNIL